MLLILAKTYDSPKTFLRFHSFSLFSFEAAFHSIPLIFKFLNLLTSSFWPVIPNASSLSFKLISYVLIVLILRVFHLVFFGAKAVLAAFS
jgi:hypothetical protein